MARTERLNALKRGHQCEDRCWFLWRWLKASRRGESGANDSRILEAKALSAAAAAAEGLLEAERFMLSSLWVKEIQYCAPSFITSELQVMTATLLTAPLVDRSTVSCQVSYDKRIQIIQHSNFFFSAKRPSGRWSRRCRSRCQ